MFTFAFATGIENSAPTIDHGHTRYDQLEACGFYKHWRTDFELVKELGLRFLRYGPPIHTTWLGDGKYDWEFSDQTFTRLRKLGIVPIADLCHFAVPDWVGNFQNRDFPQLFARYARDFALRYPWVQLYTPVNEMFICASFSARRGFWNEQLKSDRGFVTALKHVVKANVMAMHSILAVRPDALFIQSESSEYFHAESPRAIPHADIYNAARFVSLDLNYGRQVEASTYVLLRDNGMSEAEYDWFMHNGVRRPCVMGNDYYQTNEHWVDGEGGVRPSGEVFGYCEITREYHARYGLPIMHTETNLDEGPNGDEAVNWLLKEWANVLRLRQSGVPIVGFTWHSLTDQVDWDNSLTEKRGHVNARGLFDLDRNPRAVGRAYKRLVLDWSGVLDTRGASLSLPVSAPADQAAPLAEAHRPLAQARGVASPRAGPPPSGD